MVRPYDLYCWGYRSIYVSAIRLAHYPRHLRYFSVKAAAATPIDRLPGGPVGAVLVTSAAARVEEPHC